MNFKSSYLIQRRLKRRSVEIVAILAISSTLVFYFYTNGLNSRLKELDEKLQTSLITAQEWKKVDEEETPQLQAYKEINTLRGTYEYLKNTDQVDSLNAVLLNNTREAECEILFFNRLEKVGSQSLSALLTVLSQRNGFEAYMNTPRVVKPIKETSEEIKTLASELVSVGHAVSYVEHENWIDFKKFGYPKPIYINLVRHPIQKVMSAYYYIRKLETFSFYFFNNVNLKMRDPKYFTQSFSECVREGSIPECNFNSSVAYNSDWRRFNMHLCGHDAICRKLNSPEAAEIAKRKIEEEYAVVGSWEDTNITLSVMETYIPRFFRGATQVFYSDTEKFHMNSTPHPTHLDPDIEAKLKVLFASEIEVYHFAKQRLYKQFIAIRKREMKRLYG